MGLGDAKLLAAMGFGWLDLSSFIYFFIFNSFNNKCAKLLLKQKICHKIFGPYIILGCIIYLLLFEKIIKFI